MSAAVPTLDTTDFERLVEAARGQIPRYAPEWTDHNLHDPGMTLLDLLAWIVDQQIYRVGFVGDRHFRAFAALFGHRVQPPSAARGLVWPLGPVGGIALAHGAEVSCVRHPDVHFVLEHDVHLTDAGITGTDFQADGAELALSLGEDSIGSTPLDPTAAGAALVVRFDRLLVPSGQQVISIGVEVEEAYGPDPEGPNGWGPLVVQYRVSGGEWVELSVEHDSTAGLARTGSLGVRVPALEGSGGTDLRVLFDRGFFPVSPQLRRIEVNVLPVVQHVRVPPGDVWDEHPKGDGLQDQVLDFESSDIVGAPGQAPLAIRVGGDQWVERPELSRSGPDDPHYVRQPDRLVFGNGINGRRPPDGASITHDGFARTTGAAGNVSAGLAWSVPTLGRDTAVFGTNRAPMTGGCDGSTVADLRDAARRIATTRRVLLTDGDLRRAAYGAPGLAVARAEVIAGLDPELPDQWVDGARTLVVAPWRPPNTQPIAESPAYVEAVRDSLEPSRVLGERMIVRSPEIVRVDVAITVAAEAGIDHGVVLDACRRRVVRRLADLHPDDVPGPDRELEPWPLGRSVTIEELSALVAVVDGVVAVQECRIAQAGEALGDGPIPVPRHGVAVAASVDVTIVGDRGGDR